jgi:hypothetical protein
MVGWDGAGSIHAVRTRITRLSSTGAPAVGTTAYITSSALVKASFTPEWSEGDEIESLNGAGDLCVYWKPARTLKSAEISLELCTPDPQVAEILTGGAIFETVAPGLVPIGYKAPAVGSDPLPNGVSIEFWSRAVINGSMDDTLPYIHWVFTRVRNIAQDEATLENDAMNTAFTGTAFDNANWGTGPQADWAQTSDRVWQWCRVAALPALTTGYGTIAAP